MSATADSSRASTPLALGRAAYAVLLPVAAILLAALAFAVFVAVFGANPIEVFKTIYVGGFASTFAWQNTLSRAAPLILAGLAVAIPARAGMIIIGGEGALALGGLAAAATYLALPAPPLVVQAAMLLAAILAGGLLIGLAGRLRQYRGINETISSLLLSYLALAVFHQLVEGALRDPDSLDKPATAPRPICCPPSPAPTSISALPSASPSRCWPSASSAIRSGASRSGSSAAAPRSGA